MKVIALVQTLLQPIIHSLPSVLILFPFAVLIRRLHIKNSGTHNPRREAVFMLLELCVLSILSLTALSEIKITQSGISVDACELTGINLQLFRVFKDIRIISFQNGYWEYFWINLVGNIVMFIPFGFILPLLYGKMNGFKVLLAALLFSSSIEIMQLLLPRGTDIDDVWLNCLGALLGWLFFQILKRFKFINTEKYQ